ncbi:MAG: DUF11 domain-containing protein [Anaerolineae bacterium]|jgi:uncharacterized repeat protein (TIGR01451 family)
MERRTRAWIAVGGALVMLALWVLAQRVAAGPASAVPGAHLEDGILIEPGFLSVTVGVGQRLQTVVTISNSGATPLTYAIREYDPVTATDFLIVDSNKLKDFFEGHSYDTVDQSGFPSVSAAEMGQYRVVYLEPDWWDYADLNLGNLTAYVEAGGTAVINIAGNIGSALDIDPAGTDYYRTSTHNSETILWPDHPYISGEPYGGTPLVTSDFNWWGSTDHGWLTDYPPDSQLVLRTSEGPTWLEYGYGSGRVIVTTLTYGWGSQGARGAPMENLIEYALAVSGIRWLDETPAAGTVPAGGSEAVTVTFDASDLWAGTYGGELAVDISGAYTATVALPVTLTVGEFGLSASTTDAEPLVANPGERITFTVALTNSGGAAVSALFSDTVPVHAAFVDGSATGGATYNGADNTIEWSGSIPAGGCETISFQVEAKAPRLDGTQILNVVPVEDLTHGITHRRHVATDIQAPLLEDSYVVAEPTWGFPEDVLTFTIHVSNTGRAEAAGLTLQNPIPDPVTYVPGTVTGGAVYNGSLDRIEWEGTVAVGGWKTVAFQVTIDEAVQGLPFDNVVNIIHPWTGWENRSARASALTGADILVVEDDSSWQYRSDRYTGALEANGYIRYDLYPADWLGLPPASVLQSYSTTIWYRGERYGPSYGSLQAIDEYLGDGRDLLLTGQDIAQGANRSLLSDTLHIDFLRDSPEGRKSVVGIPGEIAGPISATLDSYNPDVIGPADSLAVPILEYTGVVTGPAGVRFEEGDSRVVVLGFDFEALVEEDQREELMGRIMRWLRPRVYLPLVVKGSP